MDEDSKKDNIPLDTKKILSWSGLIVALAIGYYFGIALPSQNKQKLDFEKQQYQDELQLKKDQELQQQSIKDQSATSLSICLSDAYTSYLGLMKLNSNYDGTWKSYGAQTYVEGKYTADKADCFKEYPQN